MNFTTKHELIESYFEEFDEEERNNLMESILKLY